LGIFVYRYHILRYQQPWQSWKLEEAETPKYSFIYAFIFWSISISTTELEIGLALAVETSKSSQDFLVFVNFLGAGTIVSRFPTVLSVFIICTFNIIHTVPSILFEFTISNDSEDRN
jgi:hypothetical protein